MTPDAHARAVIRRRLEAPVVAASRRLPEVAELLCTERDPAFERARRVRKVVGAFRYGTFAEGHASGTRHRNVESAIDRLFAYLTDGNQEHLVDAANLCEIEWNRPGSHSRPHFTPSDDGPHKAVEA